MANPRTTSDLWDDTDEVPHYLDEEAPHYPKVNARRVAIAHALGVAGVIGTVALAAAAFAPHVSGGIQSVRSLFAKEESFVVQPRAVMQVQPRPVQPQPAAAPVETATPRAPAPVEPPPVEPTAAPVVSPSTTAQPSTDSANSPSAANSLSTTSQTPASSTPTAPSEPAAPPAAAPQTPSQALVTPAPKSTTAPQVRHPRPEPRLTWGEIQRRKDRYAEWLQEQHLEPVR